jgi:hypothetical protein
VLTVMLANWFAPALPASAQAKGVLADQAQTRFSAGN